MVAHARIAHCGQAKTINYSPQVRINTTLKLKNNSCNRRLRLKLFLSDQEYYWKICSTDNIISHKVHIISHNMVYML